MVNLFEDWQKLGRKDILNIDKNSAFPLLRWCSGNPENLPNCEHINSLFFKIPNTITISLLMVNCKTGFYKYPKKTKQEDDDKEELLKKYVCKIYRWSESEYKKNRTVINNEEEIKNIQQMCGLDKKECKILGVEYGTIEKYKFVEQPKGLADFM